MSEMQAETKTTSNIDDIVVRARTDPQALGSLYDRYYDRVFRYCLHRLFVKEVAADVTSSVFLSVATHIRDFEGATEDDFRNWMYAISTRQADAWIRSTKRRDELLKAAAMSGRLKVARESHCEPEQAVEWSWLYRAIARLKPKHQTLIALRFFEDVPYEQIARILHSKPASLRVMTVRVLDKLRRLLEKSQPGKAGDAHV
jgi:RNA polymerase sigma-70 factor (ECF subfamily)